MYYYMLYEQKCVDNKNPLKKKTPKHKHLNKNYFQTLTHNSLTQL